MTVTDFKNVKDAESFTQAPDREPQNYTSYGKCGSTIDRIFQDQLLDFNTIVGSGRPFIDSTFPHQADGMVHWSSSPRTKDRNHFRDESVFKFDVPLGQHSLWG